MPLPHNLADFLDKEPMPDIGICSECGWRGYLSDCQTEEEGDWESGYHMVPICPRCPDGGCIDDYDYSHTQMVAWNRYKSQE